MPATPVSTSLDVPDCTLMDSACRRTIQHKVLLHHTSVVQQSTRSMHRKRNSCSVASWWITFNLRVLRLAGHVEQCGGCHCCRRQSTPDEKKPRWNHRPRRSIFSLEPCVEPLTPIQGARGHPLNWTLYAPTRSTRQSGSLWGVIDAEHHAGCWTSRKTKTRSS